MENAAAQTALLDFLRPPRSHQTGFSSHSRILSRCVQGFSLTRRQERRGAAWAKVQTQDPSWGLGSLQELRCRNHTRAPAGSGSREGARGAARRSRGGRGVPGRGRPTGACSPRACGAGWARGGTSLTQRLFTNKLQALGSDAFRRVE